MKLEYLIRELNMEVLKKKKKSNVFCNNSGFSKKK